MVDVYIRVHVPDRRTHLFGPVQDFQSLPTLPLKCTTITACTKKEPKTRGGPGLIPCSVHNCFQNSIPTTK